jgi:hypothetical protein
MMTFFRPKKLFLCRAEMLSISLLCSISSDEDCPQNYMRITLGFLTISARRRSDGALFKTIPF